MSIGHKIGKITDFFYIAPPLTQWLIKAVLLDDQFVEGGGYGGDIDEDGIDFYKRTLGDINWIMVTSKNNKLVIQLGVKKPLKNPSPTDNFRHFINTRLTYAIDPETMDVFNSEY